MNEISQLKISSELMQNYKSLRPASTEKHMQAVLDNQQKCFLSINDQGNLYITYEEIHSETGWTRKNISKGIQLECKEQTTVESFSLAKDRKTDKYILAAVLKGITQQYLYISVSTTLSSLAWMRVELNENIKTLPFYDICVSAYMDNIYISVYYLAKNKSIERYLLCSLVEEYKQWKYFPLPTDFTELSGTVLGRAGYSKSDGTYTLGKSGKTTQLLYTPAYNYYDPEILPTSSRLVMPHKADILSVFDAPEKQGMTDVFICGECCLSYFSYENQDDMAQPVLIARSPHFTDVKQMFSFSSKGKIYVWILNGSKEVYYMFADISLRSDPGAWSVIMLLKDELDYICPFKENQKNVLFGYTKNGKGILGYESEETSLWTYVTVFTQRNESDPLLINSFVTLISTPKPEQEVHIKAKEYGIVDINGGVYTLKENPITVKSNAAGQIRITQMAETVTAMEFDVWLDSNRKISVDPGSEMADRLLALNSGDKLRDAVIISQKGEKESLIPKGTPTETTDTIALAIDTLSKANKHVNGICLTENREFAGVHIRFHNNHGQYLQVTSMPPNNMLQNSLGGEFHQHTVYSSEEVFGFLRTLTGKPIDNGFFDVVIDFFENAWHFIVKTAEEIVSFVIDCAKKVIACVIEVFDIIRVGIEKVIAFLKYVFNMDDIIMVRDFIKKLLNLTQQEMKDELVRAKGKIKESFEIINRAILEWGGIEDIGDIGKMTMDSIYDTSEDCKNFHDVKGNYLLNTLTENIDCAKNELNLSLFQSEKLAERLEDLINIIENLFDREKVVIDNLIGRIRNEFFGDKSIADMSILILLEKLGAIMASAMIEGLEAIVEAMFELLIYLLDVLFEVLNKEVYIPCVSEFLDLCGVRRFSMLDLMCFVPAFLGSVVYKIVTQKPLVSQELHTKIMNIKKLSDLTEFRIYDTKVDKDISAFSKDAFLAHKYISGIASFVEIVVAGINTSLPTPSMGLSLATAACALIDGGMYVINSFFIFNPLGKEFSTGWQVAKYTLTVIKYSAFVAKGVWLYYTIKKNKGQADKLDKMFGTIYAVTSAVAIGGNIAFIIKASQFKSVNKDEQNLFILDTASLIPDNIRNVADGVLKYIRPETPVIFGITLGVRSLCGLGYGVMQIVEGHNAYAIK